VKLHRNRQSGQSMVEYLVIAAIAVALIAVPFEDKPSVVALMLDAVRTAYAKFLGALSLPQ
jgi:hypothetical protein